MLARFRLPISSTTRVIINHRISCTFSTVTPSNSEFSTSTAPTIDFQDAKTSFAGKTTYELLLSCGGEIREILQAALATRTLDIICSTCIANTTLAKTVFTLCTIPPLVNNAHTLINLSYKIFSKPLTNFIVKKTFFAQFCGGETTDDLKPCIR